MPTNVSEPIWACNVCGTRFKDDIDAATRCESAPPPVHLPDGTPLLHVDRTGEFTLLPLTSTEIIGTSMSVWNSTPGHYLRYRLELDAMTISINGNELHPERPGFLQIAPARTLNRPRTTAAGTGNVYAQWGTLLGLGAEHSPARDNETVVLERFSWDAAPDIVAPITPEVADLFDALDADLDRYARTDHQTRERTSNFALFLTGGDQPRASALLAFSNNELLDTQRAHQQQAWLQGQAITTVRPSLTSPSRLTASKLPKTVTALVEAAGVPWPPRTSASEYLNHLVRKALVTDTSHDSREHRRLFGGPAIIAVGAGKGGVGKSTVAAAMAHAIAATGKSVTLVDADLDGPSQHLLFDLGDVAVDDTQTRIIPTTITPGLRVFSHGQIPGAIPTRWTAEQSRAWLRFIGSTLAVTDDDYLIIDMPAGQGVIVQDILGYHAPAEAAVLVNVTTADPLSISDAERALRPNMHDRHIAVVVENMSYAMGDTDSGQTVHIRLRGEAGVVEQLARDTGSIYGGSMPWSDSPAALAGTPELVALTEHCVKAVNKHAAV